MFGLLIILALISLTNTDIVKWVPNSSMNFANNYVGGKLPCSRQTVVFEFFVEQTISLDGDINLNGIVLPSFGDIVLESGALYFGAIPDDQCSDGYVEYSAISLAGWDHPDVWSAERFNKATPDSERVPCFDDVVQFPEHNYIVCQLPDQPQQIRQLLVGKKNVDDLQELINNVYEDNNFLLNFLYKTGIILVSKSCTAKAGCPCQNRPTIVKCSIKHCPKPTCVAPIKPIGHCCKICGGALIFDIGRSFDLVEFKQLVNKTINSYGGGLIFHIGRIAHKVQLVVVEEGDYDGRSSEAVNEVRYLTKSGWVDNESTALLSGTPLYKYGLGGELFVSIFFIVIFVMGLVYGYYYMLPNIRNPLMGRSWLYIGTLARFQRRSESVVSLTRRDSIAPGFRNPLYDSNRGRVQVTESFVED